MSWGRDLPLDDLLTLKPKGHFRIKTVSGQIVCAIHMPGEPTQVMTCPSPGVANQLAIKLTDAGLAGFVEPPRA